jgi:hypothetical protein
MKFFIVLLCAVFIAACSQNSKKSGAAPVKPAAPSAQVSLDAPIPEEILARYKGVSLEILEIENGKKTAVDVLFGETVQVEGLPITITVIQFFPDFKMSDADGYYTASLEPNNVAARVSVTSGEHDFSGWLFADYPGIHPFPDPKYDLVLLKAIEK